MWFRRNCSVSGSYTPSIQRDSPTGSRRLGITILFPSQLRINAGFDRAATGNIIRASRALPLVPDGIERKSPERIRKKSGLAGRDSIPDGSMGVSESVFALLSDVRAKMIRNNHQARVARKPSSGRMRWSGTTAVRSGCVLVMTCIAEKSSTSLSIHFSGLA
jgi:hypothetical protein